jgi:transposase
MSGGIVIAGGSKTAFCRLKDFRRVATRYDKLALNFLSAVVLAAIIAFWI